MATQSSPIVSYRPTARATSDFVPTPSVVDTSSGFEYRPGSKAKKPPNPPMPPTTSGRAVDATTDRIRPTASSAASRLTPAARDVSWGTPPEPRAVTANERSGRAPLGHAGRSVLPAG